MALQKFLRGNIRGENLIKFGDFKMAKKTTKIGKASKACPMYSKKTGKRIRTKAERKKCMKRIMKGPKKKKRKSRRKRRK